MICFDNKNVYLKFMIAHLLLHVMKNEAYEEGRNDCLMKPSNEL